MMPVRDGKIEPPKKRSSQKAEPTYSNFDGRNGIGKAHNTAQTPTIRINLNDFIVLYPPSFVVTIPPQITPLTGPEKHVTVK